MTLSNLRNSKFYVMVICDLLLFATALWVAYLTRFEFAIPPLYLDRLQAILPLVLVVKGGLFFAFGMYRGMWRYTSLSDSYKLLKVTFFQTVALVATVAYLFHFTGVPRSVFLIDWLLTLFGTLGLRIAIRTFYSASKPADLPQKGERKTALILGTGRAGELICRELMTNGRLNYHLAGFVDDDPARRGRTIHNKAILGTISDLPALVQRHEVDEVFIAVSEASAGDMRRIINACETAGVDHKILPPMGEIMDGKVTINELREVNYLDLLGRSPVELDEADIGKLLTGKTVLVTGCGGSIGSELCRQIMRYQPGKLVLVDASEFNLYQLEMELCMDFGFKEYATVLGSICDEGLMDRTFATHQPQVVFHAAAYKHVPMLERNPWQAVSNNILGTQCAMRAAHNHGVERFVLVSTDKAVRSTNIMGASKRVTEQLMHAFAQSPTTFMAVRFGNVVGSSGSVVPLFRKQIARGGPVTVTHPDVCRYFMSISEAAQLILQAGTMGRGGGEIFILDMGVPVKIADMAADLIRLSGKKPGCDIEIVFTGLREGEKLFEELITEGEDILRTEHDKIRVLGEPDADRSQERVRTIEAGVRELARHARAHDSEAIRAALKKLVPDFHEDPAGKNPEKTATTPTSLKPK